MRAQATTKMNAHSQSDVGPVRQVRPVGREPDPGRTPVCHYHLAGVGGIGMSGLAQVLVKAGRQVSGSDRCRDAGQPLDVLDRLEQAGVRLVPQDGSGVEATTAALVVSSAIEADSADRLAAHRLGVPIVHRAAMLARLLKGRNCVAVTGTSGKSTVTAMIGWILAELGADPVVVNGAEVIGWEAADRVGNVRWGQSDLWVIEADESDRSLLEFTPDWAVVTNVSLDHFSAPETRALFREFTGRARKGVLDLAEDPAVLRGVQPELRRDGCRFRYRGVPFELGLPGRHNAENAVIAVALCEKLGYAPDETAAALATFRGIRRRLETVSAPDSPVRVIDDYAHNPEKIRASWQSVAAFHERVIGVWRPHGYGPLRHLREELADTLASLLRAQDRLFILPVYDAGGTANRTQGTEVLVRMLKARGCPVTAVGGYDDMAAALADEAEAGDAVLVMGARDPELPLFARRVAAELAK